MQSRDFVYWLQGLFELSELKTLNTKQVDVIRKHLAMVFVHEIDPSMGNKEHQVKLDQIHKGVTAQPQTSMTSSTYYIGPRADGIAFNC